MATHHFGAHAISVSDKEPDEALVIGEALAANGMITNSIMRPGADLQKKEEEEEFHRGYDHLVGSEQLAGPRRHVVACLTAIVRDAFARHGIDTTSGIDIGSGSTGYMFANLLPDAAKSSWVQMELSQGAVEANQKRHPGRPVVQGSYLRMRQQGLSNMFRTVTGLSSLDATAFLDDAAEEIAASLREGGHLLHFQDTRPGMAGVFQQLTAEGVRPPYRVHDMTMPATKPNSVLEYQVNGMWVTAIELFRRRLEAAIGRIAELEIVESAWVSAVGLNMAMNANQHYAHGMMIALPPQGTLPVQTAAGVLTVARKKK